MSFTEITPDRISDVEKIIRPHIRHTPVMRVALADFDLGAGLLDLKLECLQHSGSFKARGAFANLLTREVPASGVVAASGGNHGAAVAYAAMKLGIKATIFVPAISAKAKTDRIRSFGAELVIGGERYADALAASQSFAVEAGAMQVHAYDQVETMLGQGTLGMEIEEDLAHIDTLLVAVGGGGLIGGVSAWYQGRIKIVAVEPEEAPTLNHALAAGHPVDSPAGGVAADSLAPRQVGKLMFPIAQNYVAQSVLVSDDDIRAAQSALWNRLQVVTEAGGAAAFATILSGKYQPAAGERVAVLLCGANTTAVKFD